MSTDAIPWILSGPTIRTGALFAKHCISLELLRSQMDVEGPEAAMIISVSLNKKNEASMKTSHTDIMSTLVGLCAPSPNDVEGKVPIEPVRETTI